MHTYVLKISDPQITMSIQKIQVYESNIIAFEIGTLRMPLIDMWWILHVDIIKKLLRRNIDIIVMLIY